jgi:hypothetical protein
MPTLAVSGATAGRTFTYSVWIFGEGSSIGKRMSIDLRESGGASADNDTLVYFTVVAGWQRMSVTRTIAYNDRTLVVAFIYGASDRAPWLTTGDHIVIDGVQLEEKVVPESIYSDNARFFRGYGSCFIAGSKCYTGVARCSRPRW